MILRLFKIFQDLSLMILIKSTLTKKNAFNLCLSVPSDKIYFHNIPQTLLNQILVTGLVELKEKQP